MFALGVTNNVQRSELLSIASSSSHMFRVDSYATLNGVTKKIEGGKCCYQVTVGEGMFDTPSLPSSEATSFVRALHV